MRTMTSCCVTGFSPPLVQVQGVLRMSRFRTGDLVVFCKTKQSARPGPRAKAVHPAEHGDTYSYLVDKFWVVARECDDGTLELLTRRGKKHHVAAGDPCLRHAHWWERLWYRSRFPSLAESVEVQHSN